MNFFILIENLFYSFLKKKKDLRDRWRFSNNFYKSLKMRAVICLSCNPNSFKKCSRCARAVSRSAYTIFYGNLFSRRISSLVFSDTENTNLSTWMRRLVFDPQKYFTVTNTLVCMRNTAFIDISIQWKWYLYE